MITFVVGFVFILADFAVLIYLNLIKSNEHSLIHSRRNSGAKINPEEYYKVQYWSLMIAACIIIVNEAGKHALSYFVSQERYETQTKILIEKVKVITVFKFLNSAIVPMAASFFAVTNLNAQFEAGGLLDDISAVLIYYAIIQQLWYMIDPWHLIKICR